MENEYFRAMFEDETFERRTIERGKLYVCMDLEVKWNKEWRVLLPFHGVGNDNNEEGKVIYFGTPGWWRILQASSVINNGGILFEISIENLRV